MCLCALCVSVCLCTSVNMPVSLFLYLNVMLAGALVGMHVREKSCVCSCILAVTQWNSTRLSWSQTDSCEFSLRTHMQRPAFFHLQHTPTTNPSYIYESTWCNYFIFSIFYFILSMYIYTSFVYAGIYYKDKHKEIKCYSKNKQITYHPLFYLWSFSSVITACGEYRNRSASKKLRTPVQLPLKPHWHTVNKKWMELSSLKYGSNAEVA